LRRRREAPRAVVERAVGANRLALIRAFCGAMGPSTRPRRRSVHNFFAVVNPPMPTSSRARKRARAASDVGVRSARPRIQMWQKSAFHRHFFITSKFSRAIAPTKTFSARSFTGDGDADAAERQGAALTHKIKWSHCYFFPAVVIGW
jgi:hypothetical protein